MFVGIDKNLHHWLNHIYFSFLFPMTCFQVQNFGCAQVPVQKPCLINREASENQRKLI